MFYYKKQEITLLANENGFKSETLEKVLRLVDVLEFINNNKRLSSVLVLKGGTAINFTIFNLPRLGVDIDLDFSMRGNKEEMLIRRKEIMLVLKRYMEINGYNYNKNSKNHYALDSFVFSYVNVLGNKDNLKIEKFNLDRTPQYLSVTLRGNERINMKLMGDIVKEYIDNLMILNDDEEKFISLFEKKIYNPSLLVNDEQILDRIKFHPMAMWKVN